ncbi:Rne/Rng family ribonuclease, partial [Streptomyces sp. NPDC060194]|uniref:Rne/Rng family ribonuclease n=1 Tax=Streptomyces sp. NPDC060194 TaxID=3347069 RepID=UPI00364F52FC
PRSGRILRLSADTTPAAEELAPASAAAPRTPRRRATRKATAPAAPAGEPSGAPEAGEIAEAVAAADTVEAAPAAPAEEAPAPAARTPRRRATRKATAPAGAPRAAEAVEVADAPVAPEVAETAVAEPVTAAVEAAPAVDSGPAVEAAPAAEDEAPRGRTRRRAVRKATSPAGSPQAAQAVETPAPAAETAPAAEEDEVEEEVPAALVAPVAEEVVAEEAPAPRTRRRATRRASAPAGSPQDAQTAEPAAAPAQDETPAQAPAETPAATPAVTVADAVDAPRGRRNRRAVRKATFSAEAPERDAARAAEEDGGSRRRPAVAVFRAPVFSEPMFQTPESAAAAAAQVPAPAAAPAVEPEDEAVAEPEGDDSFDESGDRPSRRRRRGGRRRRRGDAPENETEGGDDESPAAEDTKSDEAVEPAAAKAAEAPKPKEPARRSAEADAESGAVESADEDDDEAADDREDGGERGSGSSSSRRRRRRRRRSGDSGGDDSPAGSDDPERTVVKVREPRRREVPLGRDEQGSGFDEVTSIKGSTRMEAKKQRRREGREQGRRRVPIITEAEFLARREAVDRVMVVRQSGERTQIGVLEDDVLVEHYVNKEEATSYVGNVYLGKVQNVLPSMEAAFIDIGKGRNAVLYAGEVNFEALGMAHGPRRIETALKSGQSVLVQVTKDPIGHKGARLTSQVSLPGRYLVYVPEGSMTGISRKLPDTERARLKTILKKIVPEDAGVIVRTAAEGASEDELRRDVERLQQQWEDIQKKAKSGGASNQPTLLYGEPDMTVRVVRDIFNEDFSKVIVSGDEAWSTIHGYVSHVAPDLADRLSRWTSEVDVFATYRIDEQLMKALDRKVYLPSGGSLVIDKTEAMIVVDVNTGKFTGQGGNLEETVTRNNLEAAEEIVRQLRLRDLGGIVVIDFIDMVLESNRDLVLRRLLECLGRDRTKHQVAEVTSLGLVQMTRKRVGQGLLESFSETCVHCNGRGVIVHMEQPTASGGGGKRGKKRGKGGNGEGHDHEHEVVEPAVAATEVAEAVDEVETETEAEVAAEAAAPVALPSPDFSADEELFSSIAEAAASVRGRGRRRATRKASAPAGE